MKTLAIGSQIKFFVQYLTSTTSQIDTVIRIEGNVLHTASGRIFSRLHRVPSELWIATHGDFCVI